MSLLAGTVLWSQGSVVIFHRLNISIGSRWRIQNITELNFLDEKLPQTVACQLGVLALNLYIRILLVDFVRLVTGTFCHTSLLILTLSKYAIQNVAVSSAKVPTTKYVIFFLSA